MKECGVTILSKNNELIARYDLVTDSVAPHIAKADVYISNPAGLNAESYKPAAKIYYAHMAYLTKILNYYKPNTFDLNEKLTVDISPKQTVSYDYNRSISNRIKELYEYKDSTRSTLHGTKPWSNNIAKRFESDFYDTSDRLLNGCYYDIKQYGDKNNLLSYLKDRKFTEYIIEVDVSADEELLNLIKQLYPDEIDAISNTAIKSTGKLEIIYVEI